MLNQIIKELTEQKLYKFGEPWRLTEKTFGVVVPIIQTPPKQTRNYVVIEETKDQVELKDSGSIGKVNATNKGDKPVFMRGGVTLKGQGTQSRAVSYGIILLPQKPQILTTVCIHASKGIRPSADFDYSDSVLPQRIQTKALLGNQSAVWSAVQAHAGEMVTSYQRGGMVTPQATDDFVGFMGAMESVDTFKEDVTKLLAKIPADLNGQVGMVVLDRNGVAGLELFDHPDSWRAFSKNITRSYSNLLTKEEDLSEIFELKPDRVANRVFAFLEETLVNLEQKSVHKDGNTETFVVVGNNVGEYTLFNDCIIHLVLARKDEEDKQKPINRTPILPYRAPPIQDRININWTHNDPPDYPYYATNLNRKGAKQLFTYLNEEPHTWSFLATHIDVSPRTLSKLTKQAIKDGIIEKKLRSNGKVVYAQKE